MMKKATLGTILLLLINCVPPNGGDIQRIATNRICLDTIVGSRAYFLFASCTTGYACSKVAAAENCGYVGPYNCIYWLTAYNLEDSRVDTMYKVDNGSCRYATSSWLVYEDSIYSVSELPDSGHAIQIRSKAQDLVLFTIGPRWDTDTSTIYRFR